MSRSTWNLSATRRAFGKKVAGEVPVGVRHVERHPLDVLAARDVRERRLELVGALALHDLHEPLVLVVHDHRHESAQFQLRLVLEEVLIDADLRRPWVETRASAELELLAEDSLQKSRRAAKIPPHRFQVTEVLARPEEAPSASFPKCAEAWSPRSWRSGPALRGSLPCKRGRGWHSVGCRTRPGSMLARRSRA